MSASVFPVLPGLTYSIFKRPQWGTRMQRAISGRELRVQDYANPIWQFTLTFDVLHDFSFGAYSAPNTALRTLMNFFNQMNGAWDTFLFDDTSDDSVTTQTFGTGDGTTTIFQLSRQLVSGGFNESIIAPNVVTTIFDNGTPVSPSDYSVDPTTGLVTFGVAPSATHTLTWTGTFYFRVRFNDDAEDFEEFYHNLWALKTLKLTSVLL